VTKAVPHQAPAFCGLTDRHLGRRSVLRSGRAAPTGLTTGQAASLLGTSRQHVVDFVPVGLLRPKEPRFPGA
jgi:hypothetical protein